MIRAALFVITVQAALQALAQESKAEFKPTPWHLVDLWWDIGQDMPFESYSIDVDISADVAAKDGTLVVTVGQPVANRKERKVQLIGK